MTKRRRVVRRAAACAVALGWAVAAWAGERTEADTPSCAAPTARPAIAAKLDRSAERIQADEPLTIVAIGSSSTKGTGATEPEMSYPSRLEHELRERFPAIPIRVVNQGVGGQDVAQELKRLGRDAVAEHPDLVIWQVGTNAVLRRDDVTGDEKLIAQGVALLKGNGIDVVLMDLQYAPRVLSRRASGEMERLIAEIADREQVGLFRRFAIMREWERTHRLAPAAMIGADGLHMTDASYRCLASLLADSLVSNWTSRHEIAQSARPPHAALARLGRSKPAPLPVASR